MGFCKGLQNRLGCQQAAAESTRWRYLACLPLALALACTSNVDQQRLRNIKVKLISPARGGWETNNVLSMFSKLEQRNFMLCGNLPSFNNDAKFNAEKCRAHLLLLI